MAGNNFFWYASGELLFPQFNLKKQSEGNFRISQHHYCEISLDNFE